MSFRQRRGSCRRSAPLLRGMRYFQRRSPSLGWGYARQELCISLHSMPLLCAAAMLAQAGAGGLMLCSRSGRVAHAEQGLEARLQSLEQIAEVVVLDKAVEKQDRVRIETYFRTKWGLGSSGSPSTDAASTQASYGSYSTG